MQTRQNRSVLSSMLQRCQRHARAQYLISVDAEPTLAGTRRGAPDARLRSAIPKHAASRAGPSGAWRRFDRKALFPRFHSEARAACQSVSSRQDNRGPFAGSAAQKCAKAYPRRVEERRLGGIAVAEPVTW